MAGRTVVVAMGDSVRKGVGDVDPFDQLVAAIDGGSVEAVRHALSLCDLHHVDLAQRKISRNGLTVFGHATVSKSDPELLEILFTRPEFDANLLENDPRSSQRFHLLHLASGENGPPSSQRVHLLHLAAEAGNTVAAGRLCSFANIDVSVGKAASSIVFFTCLQGGDATGIRLILQKFQRALPPSDLAALLRSEDKKGMTALHFAAWEGREDIVAILLEYKDAVDVNAKGWRGFTALHLATWRKSLGVVGLLLAHPSIDPQIKSDSLWRLEKIKMSESPGLDLFKYDGTSRGPAQKSHFLQAKVYNTGTTALHCAVLTGNEDIVDTYVRMLSSKARLRKVLNCIDDEGMTPLHYAVVRGDASIVEELMASSTIRGQVEDRRDLSPLDMAYSLLEKSDQKNWSLVLELKAIVQMLLQRSDVQGFVQKQYKDRQIFVDAANAMLLGAALIASLSFAGWLQPPLGFQPYYENKYLMGSAPPETYEAFAAVQHRSVQVFWIFNSLSFFFAITTMVTGAGAALPCRANVERAEVEHVRTLLIRASIVLSASVFFVLVAFIAAGFACLPPTITYQWGLITTSVFGGSMCLVVLLYFYKRIVRLLWLGELPRDFTHAMLSVAHITLAHDSVWKYHSPGYQIPS